MVFELSAEINDSAQIAIDDSVQSPDQVRTTVALQSQNGSFQLSSGVLATFFNGESLQCTGSAGNNALHFVSSSNVTVASFTKGVLRFEQCSQIQDLTAQSAKVALGGSPITSMAVTDCYVQMVGCTPLSALVTGGSLESYSNTYQALVLSSGYLFSQKDTFTSLTVSGDSRCHLIGATISGAILVSGNPMIHLENCTFTTLTGSGQVTIKGGTLQALTISGETAIVVIDGITGEAITLQSGSLVVNSANVTALTSIGGSINSRNLTAETVNLTNTQAIISNGALDTVSFTNGQITLADSTTQSLISTASAITSSNNQGANFTIAGGTLISINDDFETVSGTLLKGRNEVTGLGATALTLTGDNNAEIHLMNNDAEITLSNFGSIDGNSCTSENINILNSGFAKLVSCVATQGTITAVDQFFGASSQFAGLLLTGVMLATTKNVSDLVVVNCGKVIDSGSTIQSNNTSIDAINSNVQGVNCLANLNGGTGAFTGTSVVVATNMTALTNTGLSMGVGFNYLTQGASVVYNGVQMVVGTTVGDVLVTATTGNVDTIAGIGITNTAVAGISSGCGGGWTLTASAGSVTVGTWSWT